MEFSELIRKFWEENKKDIGYNYNITYDIGMSLFKGIKDAISSRDLPEIHIMYFGKFKRYYSRILSLMETDIKRYINGSIDKKEFEQYATMLVKSLVLESGEYKKRNYERYYKVIKYLNSYRYDKDSKYREWFIKTN